MSHPQGAQSALELAFRVGVVMCGTRAEKAQSIGIDGVRETVVFESLAEVLEVVPSGIALDETSGHAEAGTIVGCQKEGLLGGCWPPLVNGAIMLPKFADQRPTETSESSRFTLRLGNEVREVGFDIFLDGGASPLELVEAIEFISHKLVVGWHWQSHKVLEKLNNCAGPNLSTKSSAGRRNKARLILEPSRAQLVEPRSTDLQMGAGCGCINNSVVKINERFANKIGGQSVGNLFFSSQ
jgi:hypothetical protein